MGFKGKINQYVCKTCEHEITTIDSDEGTTPMLIDCVIKGCGGRMISQFYMVFQGSTPEYEWYRPKGKLKNKMRKYREHVAMGGLLMRPLPKQDSES